MRLIGHLPTEAAATMFSDYLFVEGVQNEVESDGKQWAVWVHAEDECGRATELLRAYQANPFDTRFTNKAEEATRRRRIIRAQSEEAARRILDREAVFRGTMPYGVGALTAVIMFLCVALAILAWTGFKERITDQLLLTRVILTDANVHWVAGLREIRSGEFWRLLTPALIHFAPLHLLFNMLWLLDLGSMLEARLGAGRLGLKIVLFGILSNLCQFAIGGPWFNGFSGVNYGLFGYIWVRGRLDPRSGLHLQPHTVAMMIIWFALCFVGVIPNVANGAHAAGLSLGIIWAYLESLPYLRRARRRAASD